MGIQNISCGLQADYYALLPYQSNITGSNGMFNMTLAAFNDFCYIEQINITLRSGTVLSTTIAGAIIGYNAFKQFASSRCFTGQIWPPITPIGYGTCRRLVSNRSDV
jgi:hypothetical protein